jgi:hypothetical protein
MPSKTKGKVEAAKQELTVHLPDTRGVIISRWGRGNMKLGMDGVYTYSRLPGRIGGTCPGATPECQNICYAMRVIKTPPVWDVWARNGDEDGVLDERLPPDAKIVRIHVSGDFDTPRYIQHWINLVLRYPKVRFFGYTRSWRVPELLPDLNRLRALPNVQLFASMDKSMTEWPPEGWRCAWLEDDPRVWIKDDKVVNNRVDYSTSAIICPEETGRKANCQTCNYCILGRRGDVVFLLH